MRVIKFRAFDKALKKWTEDLAFAIGRISENIDRERFELCQFTGLHDSRRTEEYPEGQEIFEGDVVKANRANTYQYGNPGYKGIYANYYIEFFDGAYYLQGLTALTAWQIEHMDLEVIGNIYEHEHLLAGGE